ncbi:MAG: hypothetical protein IJF37_01285 [Lachnospiraceae bacterium]|nr:hypothetical protein [Lachnospiraceae bacterium]
MFSEQVSEVVSRLLKRVEMTTDKFANSKAALDNSRAAMEGLNKSFEKSKGS